MKIEEKKEIVRIIIWAATFMVAVVAGFFATFSLMAQITGTVLPKSINPMYQLIGFYVSWFAAFILGGFFLK